MQSPLYIFSSFQGKLVNLALIKLIRIDKVLYFFVASYVRKRLWRPIQSPTMDERRKQTAKRRERDQIKFIDLRFERW